MSKGFVDNIREAENALLNQLEALNDDPTGGFSDAEFDRMCRKADASAKLVAQFVSLTNLKLNVVRTAEETGGIYDSVLGLEDKRK